MNVAGRDERVSLELFPAVVLGLLLGLCPLLAWGQDGIEGLISESQSGPAVAGLLAQAKAEPPQTTNLQELSIFHHRRGQARFQLGDYERAIDDLRRSLEPLAVGHTTPDGWGSRTRVENDLGDALENRGEWFAYIEHWKQVAQVNQQGNLAQYRYAHQRLSVGYSVLGDFVRAEQALKIADEVLPKLRQTSLWAMWGNNYLQHGSVYEARLLETQGRAAEAESRWRAALGYALKDQEIKNRAYGAGNPYTRSAATNLTAVRRGLAVNLAVQGKFGEAQTFARDALRETLAANAFQTTRVGLAIGAVAFTKFQEGDIAGAERYSRHALAAIQGAGVVAQGTQLATHRAALGNALVVQERWREALEAFEERDTGLRLDPAQFKRTGSGHSSWAYALHKTGESGRAAAMAGRMIDDQLKRPVPDRWALAQLRGIQGMAMTAAGRAAEALAVFRESIPELVRREGSDSAEAAGGYWRAFWHRVILEAYLDLLARFHDAGASPEGVNLVDESFRIADLARNSYLQEAIAASSARAHLPDRRLAELARRLQDTNHRVAALNRLLSRLASAPEQEGMTKVIAGLRAEIDGLRALNESLYTDMRGRYPEYAELIDPRAAGIAELSNALAPGEAAVSVYMSEHQSYVWTVGTDGKTVFRVVRKTREEVEKAVRELRRVFDLAESGPLRLRAFDMTRAHELYRAFFEQDEALWKDARVLNVIPHGALTQLPMAVLVTAPQSPGNAAHPDIPWLVRKVAIAQLPSATAFTALRRAPAAKALRQPFIGFGDPVFTAEAGDPQAAVRNLAIRRVADSTEQQIETAMRGGKMEKEVAGTAMPFLSRAFSLMSTLPDTATELREIAVALKADSGRDVFVSRQATEKNVKQVRLDNRRVVAFATHGIAPGEITGLDQPALVLSNPALTGDTDNDGFLTMEEVLALKLDADWVVLSACNTASADGRGSEAVSGLGRAFFYAGARSLLVSNWAVETTSARLLTTELFKRQAENPQLTRAEALRQSMLDLMGKKSPTGFSYAHPAFWAPFSLVGDGGR